MAQQILIDPVTRIEGHAKITIQLDDAGKVSDARFHVAEFRGFEKFCEGRPLWEMPGITARVCGICPVSHLLASAKAGDKILSVTIPPAANKLRRLMNLGQIVQSHALSFFHLSGPDLFLGMDADPAGRNIFGLIAADPDFAPGHSPAAVRPGDHRASGRQEDPSGLVGARRRPRRPDPRGPRSYPLPLARSCSRRPTSRFAASRPSSISSMKRPSTSATSPHCSWPWSPRKATGSITTAISDSSIPTERSWPTRWIPRFYQQYIGEAVEPDSYLKSPYYKPLGPTQGIYRVGPLARLNVCTHMGVPLADQELKEFRYRFHGTATSSFLYHYARLIEILAALELIERMIDDPDLTSDHLRAVAGINRLDGVGVSEAPRGTLFHHYQVDKDGLIRWVNLIIATGQNNLAMNRTVAQIAGHYIHGPRIPEGVLNRIEAGIRAFDPCLSCSTHAVGSMPLHVQLVAADGTIQDEVWRD